jgi:hypothetical protein
MVFWFSSPNAGWIFTDETSPINIRRQ